MSMCVLVPSRGRPSNIARLAEAWFTTGAEAELVVLIDDDDPELDGYENLADDYGFTLIIGEPSRIGPILNRHAADYAERCDVVGFMGDDHLPRTERWDVALEAAAGRWGVAYGNDLLQGANLATAVFIGSGIVGTLGYYVPPGLKHLYFESPWMTWGRALDSLTYLDDVVIEHLHYINGKAEQDDLYREVNADSMYSHDGARWAEYANDGELLADVQRLIAARDAA
jgi:hypothetical protein